jgi:serine/threonine protein kinase
MVASLGAQCWPDGARPSHAEKSRRRGMALGTIVAGTYRLDRLLGSGAMASVFAATHLRNANRVAVKVLHAVHEENADVRTRFLREGYAANSVRHAGTVRALDDGTTDEGSVFFVMELLEGETVESLWERRGRRLPPVEVARLMSQLLDVLSAAHANGIVHRDIKPENLFIERNGTLRVLDFGVARVLEGAVTDTRAGSVIGTLPYMAPEQTLGKSHEVDARSDVWSVGATAFALMSGRFVHEAETPEEMMVLTGSRQARSLAEAAPDVSSGFVGVVDRALQFDKGKRWPSAQSMREAFAEACREPLRAALASPETSTGASLAGEEAPCTPTLVSSGSAGASRGPVHAPARRRWRSRDRAWVPRAVVAFALASLTTSAFSVFGPPRSQPAHSMALASRQPVGPRVEVATAAVEPASLDPDTMPQGSSTASLPDAPEDILATLAGVPTAAVPLAVERRVDTGPEPTKASSPKPARANEERPQRDARPVARVAPDSCNPPYAILPVTGKKRWKRECL